MDVIEIKDEPLDDDDVTMASEDVPMASDDAPVTSENYSTPVPIKTTIKTDESFGAPPAKMKRLTNGVVTNSDGTMANCEPTVMQLSMGGDGATKKSATGLTFNPTWKAQKEMIDSALPTDIVCSLCSAKFTTGSAFWAHHMENHWNEVKPTNFLCTVCCVAYKANHICTSMTPAKRLHVCPECGMPAERLADLEEHIGGCALGMADQKLVCPRCPLAKPSIHAFWEHFTEAHWNKNLGFLGFNVRRGSEEIRLVLCLPCGGVITGNGTQDAHIRTCHYELSKMVCPDLLCKAPAETPELALEHFRDVHWQVDEERQFICEACSFISPAPRKCCRTPRWMMLCSKCGENLNEANEAAYQNHQTTCLADVGMDEMMKCVRRCKIDNIDFKSAAELTAHVVSAHPKPAVKPGCEFCSGDDFSDGTAVWEHSVEEHKEEVLNKRYLCGACGATHTGLAAYYDHQLYDHGALTPPKLNCMTCGTLNETKQELDIHQKNHIKSESKINSVTKLEEPDEEREMNCPAEGCVLTFNGLKKLWGHYRHGHWSAEKRLHFLCGDCGKVFGSVNNIMEHNTENHEGKATAHILCPTCGERFLDSDALEEHTKVCSGPRQVWPQCVVCKRYLPDKPCVTKHMVQYHPEEEVACHVCDVVMKCSEIAEHQKSHPEAGNLFAEPEEEDEREGEEEGEEEEDEDEEEDEEAMTEGDDDEDEAGNTSEEEVLPVSRRRGRGAATAVHETPTAGRGAAAAAGRGGRGTTARRGARGRGRGRGRGATRGEPVDCTFCAETFPSWDELETHFNEEHSQAMTPVVRVRKMDGCDSVGASEMTSTTFDGSGGEEENMEEDDDETEENE